MILEKNLDFWYKIYEIYLMVKKMTTEPFDWSVMIAGSWNQAILTPGGIAKEIFSIPEGERINVEIDIDGLEPPRITHDDLRIRVYKRRLVVEPLIYNLETLSKAIEIAKESLDLLPKTPVNAAGVNIKCKYTDPDSGFMQFFNTNIEDILSDSNYEIKKQSFTKQIIYKNGVINLGIENEGEECQISCNFHFESRIISEILSWLNLPVNDFYNEYIKLTKLFKIPIEEHINV